MTGCVRLFLSLLFVAFITKYASAGDTCSISTLKGTYIFSSSGYDPTKPTDDYVAYIGMLYYDGKGQIKYKYKYAGGNPKEPFATSELPGNYIVRPNCTVEVTYYTTVPPRTALYFLAPSGDKFTYVITSGSLISSEAVRISRDDLISNGLGEIFSDIRLKKDIELVGRSQKGHNLYRYRYLWSDQLYVGVMAQEVRETMPEAVVRGKDGFLRVYYEMLGLELQTWEEYIKQGQTMH